MKQVVILNGGLGTRLYPLTLSVPKCLLPIGRDLIIDWQLKKLALHNFKDVIICINDKNGNQIRDYVGTKKYGLNISYSQLPVEATTGDRLLEVRDRLNGRFLVMYGDIITSYPLNINMRGMLTLLLHKFNDYTDKAGAGHVSINEENRITGFVEKPKGVGIFNWKWKSESYANGGFYYCTPEVLDYLHKGEDITEVIMRVKSYGYYLDYFHIDIGTHRKYKIATRNLGWRTYE